MSSTLALRAGPDALAILRERGLRAEDVDVVPGASGGPKWLVLAGLDRFFFGELFAAPRTRPLHLIGSSIGSWRLACLAQGDPLAALARAHEAYIEQRYTPKPQLDEVTRVGAEILDVLLGASGVDEILTHPWARLHVVTSELRGLGATDRRWPLLASLAIAAAGNLLSRRVLARRVWRVIFHTARDDSPFRGLSDFPTLHFPLTRENTRAALLASASIPLLLSGVAIPGAAGLYRDGGIVDYHLDVDFGAGDGIVLYPHFYPHVVPGWFDKSLRWRRARGKNFRRALIVAPSPEFVATLPHAHIPERGDFYAYDEATRIRTWRQIVAMSEHVADELRELIATGRLAERIEPIAP
ncbi:MAG: patatin-like phospholipase family protein [Gemmatimonadaceae bacterium]|nr:patatin-like phospholipase family protein [Gemmatimonadaceae bacterium]NUQ91279.1 patatin-like phospholipase family protein [Gemmatimonadaceae bacterium]NUR21071.1 patatin-like phospholipase family protein [Gemmatimonadaceae bacterium]NUS96897.1 patatin-like phospholipase family protein [Gemmatimonadaceae bacterium]